ncbi:tRNA epoxyqueuosine(34) reductase QueG [Nitratireductor sp. CH_MIT9313-5]|uniref:tRNA epoxyqueuosine(34) reductase QueG n=1 Tax=Nitratireductor sp. CH_MIT9313-5 TaxID=3107764 RepID=UPI003009A1BB
MGAGAPADRLRAFVEEKARAAGFDVVAFTTPDAAPHTPERLREFIQEGRHGTMEWMAETEERRARPRNLWQDVRSIIMLGMNYGPDENPLDLLEKKDRAAISVYARNRDYHDIIKGKLKQLAGQLAARAGEDVKVFVDTAPVMEKPLAAAAGLGWQGKHTNLVSREFGSWLFLGSIFTTAVIAPDQSERDHCGSCRACLDICPTNAFPAPYQIDARRCISYLTIEHKGPIPHEFRKAMGNRIYGCDDCLAVCPWNKFAQEAAEAKLQARDDLKAPALAELLELDDAAFRARFSGSPIKRIGRGRFVRNVLIAAGNSEDPRLVPQCEALLQDEDAQVRGAAVWALSRLTPGENMRVLAAMQNEEDAMVLEEWKLAGAAA